MSFFKGLLNPRRTITKKVDDRPVSDVLAHPRIMFLDPDSLSYPDRQGPIVPGAPVTTGLMQIEYDHQPIWDRAQIDDAGPVQAFFGRMMAERGRIKNV